MSELGRHGLLLLLGVGHRLSTLGGCAWQLGCVNSSAMVHSKTLLPSKINYKSAGNCFLPSFRFYFFRPFPSFKFSPPFHHFISWVGLLYIPYHKPFPFAQVFTFFRCSIVQLLLLTLSLVPNWNSGPIRTPKITSLTGAARFLRQRQPSTPEPSCSELRSPPLPSLCKTRDLKPRDEARHIFVVSSKVP